MENNQELFKQAILDARALRDTALVQAKTALAEHFEPTIKSMMRKQLSEDMDESMYEEGMYDEMHTIKHDGAKDQKLNHDIKSENYDIEMEEILAELDAMSSDLNEEIDSPYEKKYGVKKGTPNDPYSEKDGHVEGDDYTPYNEKLKNPIMEGEEGDEDENDTEESDDEDDTEGGDYDMEDDGTEEEEGEPEDSEEVVHITVGELKDIIRDVFSQMQHDEPDGDELPGDDEEHYDDNNEIPDSDLDGNKPEEDMDEISLEEILAELELEEAQMNEEELDRVPGGAGKEETKSSNVSKVDYGSMEEELNEAIKTIKIMKKELNETNLFNAKLLYVNKIFKAKSLNEVQKTKVINAFDRATSVKEVENINKTLLESLSDFTPATKKSSLKESVGFASKPIGNAPARPIVEADAFVSRWQQLAGIKK